MPRKDPNYISKYDHAGARRALGRGNWYDTGAHDRRKGEIPVKLDDGSVWYFDQAEWQTYAKPGKGMYPHTSNIHPPPPTSAPPTTGPVYHCGNCSDRLQQELHTDCWRCPSCGNRYTDAYVQGRATGGSLGSPRSSPLTQGPNCPGCNIPLVSRPGADCWHCTGCGAVIPAMDLADEQFPKNYPNRDDPPPVEETIHVLHQGSPLCSFTKDRPVDWPEGHTWIPYAQDTMHIRIGSDKACKRCFETAHKLYESKS